jgi:hypothetical protein
MSDPTPAAAPVLAPSPGLRCPNCESVALPVEYVRKKPGRVVRIRQCAACSRRVRTVETVAGLLPAKPAPAATSPAQ